MRLTRNDRSVISEWWFSVDLPMLGAILLLMAFGALVSLAASPIAAPKFGKEPLHFFTHHVLYLLPSVVLMLGVSMLDPKTIRRVGLALFAGGVVLMVLTLLQGIEKNGGVRWFIVGGQSIQPSEFTKPGFIILTAWLFAENAKRRDVPAFPIAAALYVVFAICLVLQPDFGQTFLITLVWGGLFFLTGYSLVWIGLGGAASLAGFGLAYLSFPHVKSRVDRFLYPSTGDTHQTDTALASFRNGGWFGRGPGEGSVSHNLPDAHTDYIFAVIAEEYGIILCVVLVMAYAFIVWRGFRAASRSQDTFIRLALAGLMMLFGFQTLINMAVNVDLLPSKGMTLPFLSYGGSSLAAMALTMGLALGLARRRPEGGPVSRRVSQSAECADSSGGIRI
ncbi:MAG: putative peptidoglycan glycosyltransferase FtsW [Alphaproteobacteria bacterium]